MLVFFHIPKTGGLTFLQIMSAHYPEDAILDARDERVLSRLKKMDSQHIGAYKVLSGHIPFSVLGLCPKDSMIITFLRDPLDNCLSLYNYEVARDQKYVKIEDSYLCNQNANDFQTRHILGRELADVDEDIEEAIFRLENHVSFTGITELFDQSILLLSKKLNWRTIIYKRVNVGNYDKNSYHPSVLEKIEEFSLRDRAIYSYMKKKLSNVILNQDHIFTKALLEYKFLLHEASMGRGGATGQENSTFDLNLSEFLESYLSS